MGAQAWLFDVRPVRSIRDADGLLGLLGPRPEPPIPAARAAEMLRELRQREDEVVELRAAVETIADDNYHCWRGPDCPHCRAYREARDLARRALVRAGLRAPDHWRRRG